MFILFMDLVLYYAIRGVNCTRKERMLKWLMIIIGTIIIICMKWVFCPVNSYNDLCGIRILYHCNILLLLLQYTLSGGT